MNSESEKLPWQMLHSTHACMKHRNTHVDMHRDRNIHTTALHKPLLRGKEEGTSATTVYQARSNLMAKPNKGATEREPHRKLSLVNQCRVLNTISARCITA